MIKMSMRYQYTIESRAGHARINGCEDVRLNANKAGCCRLVEGGMSLKFAYGATTV
ncbi:MAG: hypothetical protein P1P69_05725 [Methanosarcinaceae archaeon]|nr:hypothetical protein [Methanosarcinaceae archaeon]